MVWFLNCISAVKYCTPIAYIYNKDVKTKQIRHLSYAEKILTNSLTFSLDSKTTVDQSCLVMVHNLQEKSIEKNNGQKTDRQKRKMTDILKDSETKN